MNTYDHLTRWTKLESNRCVRVEPFGYFAVRVDGHWPIICPVYHRNPNLVGHEQALLVRTVLEAIKQEPSLNLEISLIRKERTYWRCALCVEETDFCSAVVEVDLCDALLISYLNLLESMQLRSISCQIPAATPLET